jgi:hypothetical protein
MPHLRTVRKRFPALRDSSTAEDEAPPQLLCPLLEVLKQMCEMNARLECIGVEYRIARRGDAAGLFPAAVRARAHLLDLPAELLVAIARQLAEDDELAFALACRRLRQTVTGTDRRAAGARLSTGIGSAFCSVGKLEWAVVSCWLPLSDGLLLRAARSGQLEQLSWLRAHGCAWQPCEGDAEDCCSSAAAGGHLTVLQCARADGCPWDSNTCSRATAGGHLHVL